MPELPLPLLSNDYVAVVAAALIGWLPAHRVIGLALNVLPSYKALNRVQRNKFACVTLSTLHALGLLVFAVAIVVGNGALVRDSVSDYSEHIAFLTRFTAGYFLHDTINQLQFNLGEKGTAGMLVHHGFFLSGCVLLLATRAGAFLPVLWSLTEVSTPFINARTLMELTGAAKDSRLYTLNGLAILVTFTGRMVVSLLIVHALLTTAWSGPTALRHSAPLPFYVQLVASLGMTGLNASWYAKIVSMVWFRLCSRAGSDSKRNE
eukprot:Amastigsp_a4823_88.p2 type:complete len:263 gc:universal Amastigsp_a4823_88:818-30(-)